jgi:succinate dehydrogenase / fumarate reductase membrane anchor subunit
MSVNFGSKRIVVGAHYGLRDWLAQRVTALLMALFTVLVILQVVLTKGSIGYDTWSGIFSTQWMKSLTFAVIISLAYHAWVGMRDIWMDYIGSAGLRLALQTFTVLWLVGCACYTAQILWRV